MGGAATAGLAGAFGADFLAVLVVLGLAVDKPERVQSFLKASPLSFALGMAGLEGTELSRELGNVSGSLPFTVVFASDGSIAQRKLGRISQQDLDQWRGLR